VNCRSGCRRPRPRRFFFYNLYESDPVGAPLAVRNRATGSTDEYAAAVARFTAAVDAVRTKPDTSADKKTAAEDVVDAAHAKHEAVISELEKTAPAAAQQGLERAKEEADKLHPSGRPAPTPEPNDEPSPDRSRSPQPARTTSPTRTAEPTRSGDDERGGDSERSASPRPSTRP